MISRRIAWALAAVCAATPVRAASAGSRAGEPRSESEQPAVAAMPAFTWDARAVEHLMNRAGFGARPSEVEAGVRLGAEAFVDRLLTARADVDSFFVERQDVPTPRELRELPEAEREKVKRERREDDRRQLIGYMGWWFERMASGEDPLLEKMVLFWHGFFTTSAEDVKRSYEVLRQNQFLREHALTSYADLLRGITRDPAMLTYLDNQVNRKEHPNENFARELLELFSLGEGNYSEQDVKEAARALTGRGTKPSGDYEFRKKQHDDGVKTILGVTGKHDGDALVEIVLKQPACAEFVAKRLITYLEGVPPEERRLDRYAAFLREQRYQITPFLRRLFLDPDFYRADVLGARVQGPVEYMVGTSRRLGVPIPPAILAAGASLLGQRLFAPPSVKGWEEGEAWITTASLMQRGNLAGLMLGIVTVDDVLSQDALAMATPDETGSSGSTGEMSMTSGTDDEMRPKTDKAKPKAGGKSGVAYQALRRVEASGWTPSIHLTARLQKLGLKSDREILERMLDELLAVPAPAETRSRLLIYLAEERAGLDLRDGRLLEGGADCERVLRRLAHLILSLPEAQLG